MNLVLCAACGRHVREVETACPFCGALSFRSAPNERRPRGPRGAMLVAGLAVSLTTSCSETGDDEGDAAVVDSGHQHHEDAGAADATVDAHEDADEPDFEAGIPIYDAVPPRPDKSE